MTDEEMEFVRKVNIDKANNKTGIAIVLIVLSMLTYIAPLAFGEFDFGIIFEGISLIFLLIAKMYMSEYKEVSSKKLRFCSPPFTQEKAGCKQVFRFSGPCSPARRCPRSHSGPHRRCSGIWGDQRPCLRRRGCPWR